AAASVWQWASAPARPPRLPPSPLPMLVTKKLIGACGPCGCCCGCAACCALEANRVTSASGRRTGFADFIGPPFLMRSLRRTCRPDDKYGAIFLVCEDVNRSVRRLLHVAHPLVQVGEQGFAPQLLHLLVQQHAIHPAGARDLPGSQAAHEQVSLPL